MKFKDHIIPASLTVKSALVHLNNLTSSDPLTLFIVNKDNKIIGTLTDGDIRRGLLEGKSIEESVEVFMYRNFKYLQRNKFKIEFIDELKENEIDLIPFINDQFEIEKIIDLTKKKSVLPVDAVIMAGGEGKRLKPLTDNTPKPLLKIGNKPIIEYNIDRLNAYGIDNIYITIKYLGNKIIEYFKDGSEKDLNIKYTQETDALGTIGAITLINDFIHENILVMNSDLLTNIDFEDFFKSFYNSNSDMAVATIPYQVTLPYGVVETSNSFVNAIKEKPTYTYYSNAGIYLIKKRVLSHIPKGTFFNATDLMDVLLKENGKILNYPILGYWLDIGKHEDYNKAQEDIKHLKF